ncbi:MAG: PorP/SprF family type IX secretion system membrane protein [Bacteroidota bacterium]
MIIKSTYLFLFIIMVPVLAISQDHSFSQFYASPMYLNPSLAGNTDCARLSLNYRNQWPGIPKAYNTYQIIYDQSLPKISSGYGISVYTDRQGDNAYSETSISGAYSYQLQISEKMIMSAGLQGSYLQNSLNWDNLIFADQINMDGTFSSTNETPPENNSISMIDFSGGLTFDWDGRYYGGLAVHHMNEPSNSFYDAENNVLPMKISVHGGAAFTIEPAIHKKKTKTISPNLLYQQQGEFHQLNAGLYVHIEPLIFGTWYRHNFENPDAAIVLVGLQHNDLKFGYSYDYSLSELGSYSGGAHEVSLTWNFCIYVEKSRKVRAIKCPEF